MLHKGEGGAVGAKKAAEMLRESRSRGLGDGRENAGEDDEKKSGFTAVDFFNRSAEDDRFVEVSAPKPPPRVPSVPFPT